MSTALGNRLSARVGLAPEQAEAFVSCAEGAGMERLAGWALKPVQTLGIFHQNLMQQFVTV
jgi:hypothetical protein